MARKVARNEEHGRAAIERVMEVDADARVNIVRIRHLEFAQGRTLNQNASMQEELTAT